MYLVFLLLVIIVTKPLIREIIIQNFLVREKKQCLYHVYSMKQIKRKIKSGKGEGGEA